MPVNFQSSVGTVQPVFTLEAPPGRLDQLALEPVSPQISGARLQPVSAGRWQLSLSNAPGQELLGLQHVADLRFNALTNGSAFVELRPASLAANTGAGQPVPRTLHTPGRVVIIERQPLLESLLSTNQQRTLVLYGLPGTNYVVESREPESQLSLNYHTQTC